MNEIKSLYSTIVPPSTITRRSGNLMRARRAEWHDEYTLPSLWDFYTPNRKSHGAYWYYWTTENEIDWKNNYRLWMAFVNEYKNRGGRVTVGTDSGFIYERSEEHTSELQSHVNLVCRLLLEKKKTRRGTTTRRRYPRAA